MFSILFNNNYHAKLSWKDIFIILYKPFFYIFINIFDQTFNNNFVVIGNAEQINHVCREFYFSDRMEKTANNEFDRK